MIRRLALCTLAAACVLTAGLVAHVRLRVSGGPELFWLNPDSISIVINGIGSDDLDDASHITALQNAIDSWGGLDGSTVRLVEDTSETERARTDWEDDGLHLIVFDESNESGYFPSGSGVVAVTPVEFFSNGRIVDGDVLFNGRTYHFTTSGGAGCFDIQSVAAHELGHLIGLDHSGWGGATMYPYVDPGIVVGRSLSRDDLGGARDAYPSTSSGSISGTVERADNSPVVGAHVVARDSTGRTAGGTITNASGDFVLKGLDDGTYLVYASPLSGPVTDGNLGALDDADEDFASTEFSSIAVTAGNTTDLGTVTVDADSTLHIGNTADDYPIRTTAGATTSAVIRGSGMGPNCTLTASDADVSINVVNWFSNQVQIEVTVPAGEPVGHFDLTVENLAGVKSILTAPFEIAPPEPAIATVSPTSSAASGGSTVTVFGNDFRPGARVVIGDRIYVDGEPGGCTVDSSSVITLTLAATVGGLHDVTVIDESGVEGRLPDGFLVASMPAIATLFPTVGSADGGTEVVLTGSGFAADSTVTIDEVVQAVSFDGPTQLRVSTGAGTTGGPYDLVVTNPGGAEASTVFTFVDQPDPVAVTITPSSSSSGGGEEVTLLGSGFSEDSIVVFGADSATGAGGVEATQVTFIDAGTLTVITPAYSAGDATVLLRDTGTGQADFVPSSFTFQGSESSSGLGGACGSLAAGTPPNLRRDLSNGAWFLVLLVLVLARRRQPVPQPVRASHRR